MPLGICARNKPCFTSIAFLISFLLLSGGFAVAESLSDLRWKKRVVLIDGTVADARALGRELLQEPMKLFYRDMIIQQIEAGEIEALYPDNAELLTLEDFDLLRERNTPFVLIGKDGGVKLEFQDKLNSEAVFKLIDSMPMRQREMREQKE